AAFKARPPGIMVRLRDGVAQRVTALVKAGEADFGIGSPIGRDPDLKTTVLVDVPVSAVFPPGHPLERHTSIGLTELIRHPLILMDDHYSVRTLIDAAFESIGHPVQPAFEVSYVATALGLVKAGLGVAIVSRMTIDEPAGVVGLRAMASEHPDLLRHIALMWRQEPPPGAAG